MIKRFILLAGGIICLQACNKPAEKSFELQVKLEGLREGEKVYLYTPDTASLEPHPVDSIPYKAAGVSFEQTLEYPYPYYLVFEEHEGAVEVFADQGKINVTGNVAHIATVKVDGSAAHDTYRQAITGLMEIDRKEQALYRRLDRKSTRLNSSH